MDPGPGLAALQAWGGQVAAYGAANQTVVDKVPPDMLHMVDAHWLVSITFLLFTVRKIGANSSFIENNN